MTYKVKNLDRFTLMTDKTELPELTGKQMAFVVAVQSGKSQSDAYRLAYNTGTMPNSSIWTKASEVASNVKVALWLEHVALGRITKGITELEYTKERYLRDLADCGEACRKAGAWSTYFKSIEATGKSCGHVINAIEVSHTNKADKDLLQQLSDLLGPDASREAARRLGYQVDSKHSTH
jgi:hypothetical protein